MARPDLIWPAGAFDAIDVRARDSKVTIEGTGEDTVRLEGENDENLQVEVSDRSLRIHAPGNNEAKFNLYLPGHKAWAMDLFSRQSQFKARNIRAGLNLIFGKGEVQAENCCGSLSVVSADLNIRLRRFSGAEMPGMPPSQEKRPLVELGEWENWPDWWRDYRDQLGGEFTESVLKRFFRQSGVSEQHSGISLQTGKGDLQMEDIEVHKLTARCARGDVKLKGGGIAGLDVNIIKGDFESESCLPGDDWSISVNRGDIRLSLPADTRARLDVATRQGDIKSNTPMVRVTRQGPEAWHGGRMVGTIGTNTGVKLPEVRLTTLHGDIKIETQSMPGRHHGEAKREPLPESSAMNANSYDTPLSVLKALSEGRISVAEADRLLHSLDS